MFAITAVIGNVAWSLMYRTEKACEAAKERLDQLIQNASIGEKITDDFGHEIHVKHAALCAFIVEDLEKTKLAHVERALHQHRVQSLTQKTAEQDPSIRASMMQRQTPLITPFPGPNGGRLPPAA